MASREHPAWLAALHAARTEFGPEARRRKLTLMRRASPALADPDLLVEYHDLLLFILAYADDPRTAAEAERRLRRFEGDVRRYRVASGDASGRDLDDSGLVDTAVGHVFSFRLARALSARHPRAVEIDWESYWESDTANIPIALVPAMLWHESDAVDNDDAFNEQAWLESNRTAGTPTCLAALLHLFASSGLPEAVQEHLYDQAEIPVRWSLNASAGSRTLKRTGGSPPFWQTAPLQGRSKDLRATLSAPAPPLRPVAKAKGRRLVGDVHDVLAARVRELYPLAGASPDEVYVYRPGRGLEIVIFGCEPAIRLPHESNMGAMFVRNGVPVGYGLGALLFHHGEMAINIFPAYRSGESAFLIEEFFRLFVHHFGVRTLVVSRYQVGDGNDEGLDSGSFWFYYKLGFRPVDAGVRALAERQALRIAGDPSYRSSREMLKRLSRSDMYFHLETSWTHAHEPISLADLGYAVTRHVVRKYAGDRRAAVTGAVRTLARVLPLGSIASWTPGECLGLERLAPLVEAMGGVERWPTEDRRILARALRAKGGTRERRFVRLTQQLPRLEAGLARLARKEARERARRR
ncbi:MAG: hypothetical protein R2745_09500 [Vicinamibacterales bacterium]